MDDKQKYAGNNNISGPGFHISMGNPPFLLRYRGQEWLVEWHRFFGPTRLNKKTNAPAKKQPGEGSPFWKVAQWWFNQGCKVVDGVGQWKEEPERELKPLDAKE